MPRAAIVSFRLGGSDGVSIEAAKWGWALGHLGFQVTTVAGQGPVDHLVPGLATGADRPPTAGEMKAALAGAELVVVENICSLPLNPAAAAAVADACAGRPTVLHHHDLPWQRAHLSHLPGPADDPSWRHVTINQLSRRQLAGVGIDAVTIYNAFDCDPLPGRRTAIRQALGLAGGKELLVLQPTRALARKGVARAVALTEALRGTYWLLGPAEDGYGPKLATVLAGASCPVRRGIPTIEGTPVSMSDAYAACDVVALPSTWEGFGNPTVESAVHRRPLAVGRYPVAAELAAFGFEWFDPEDPEPLTAWLSGADRSLLDHNHAVAARTFNLADLPGRLAPVLASLGFGV